MKTALLILSLTGILIAIKTTDAQNRKIYQAYGSTDSGIIADSAKTHLRKLFSIGLHDSAIAYCSKLRSRDALDYTSLELALATAYRYKGNTAITYQYVLNSADYTLKLHGGGGNALAMIENYRDAYPLATDTVLEHMILDKVKNYYLALDYYSHPAIGLKFLFLNHKKAKLESKYNYLMNDLKRTDKKNVQEEYDETDDRIYMSFLKIIEDNNGFYTLNQIGPAFVNQFRLISASSNIDFHHQMHPYFEKAYQEKKIEAETYVNALVDIAKFNNNNIVKLETMRDSLCTLHGCAVSNTIITQNGDTLYFKPGSETMGR